MDVIVRLMLLISIFTIMLPERSTSSQKGPGKSACGYFGDTQVCNITRVPLEDIPECCTSYFYDGLMVYEDLSIDIYYSRTADCLDKLRESGKNVYVNYERHGNYAAWGSVLDSIGQNGTNAAKEAESINAFMECHSGITGLLMKYLEPRPGSEEIVGITANLKSYIEVVKPATGLEIALSFYPELFIKYYDNNPFPWIDFPTLDPCVDFYLFQFQFFNLEGCNGGTKFTGLTPINGNANYTLEKLACALAKAKIPKDKTHFMFELKPGLDADSLLNHLYCDANFPNMCQHTDNAVVWCSDTLQTFYEKGKWARDHAGGFVGAWIDLDDPYGCCNCEPYPAFRSIVAGWDSGPAPPQCPLIDRQP